MLDFRPPPPAQPHLVRKGQSRAHAQHRAETTGSLAAIHVLLLAWLAHLLTLADLHQAAGSLTPRHLRSDMAETEPQPLDAEILSRELLSLLRILYRIGARPARGMRALPNRRPTPRPTPRHTPPIRPPPAHIPLAPTPASTPVEAAHLPRPIDPKKETIRRLTFPRHPSHCPPMQTPRPATRFWYRWQYTPAV